MADPTIPPALSKEEWAKLLIDRDSFTAEPLRDLFVGKPRGNIGVLLKNGVWVSESPRDTHALAALCLHQQSFGFTAEDVALCNLLLTIERAFGATVGNWLTESDRAALAGLRDRIASLVPPSDPQP